MNLQDALQCAWKDCCEIYHESQPDWIYKFDSVWHDRFLIQIRRGVNRDWQQAEFNKTMLFKDGWIVYDKRFSKTQNILTKIEELKNMILEGVK